MPGSKSRQLRKDLLEARETCRQLREQLAETRQEVTQTKSELALVEQEIARSCDRGLCKVCMAHDITVVYKPCRHAVCCSECYASIRHGPNGRICAYCQQPIRSTMAIRLT